ncbi:U2 small nuclear ribonucleoprotein A [Euphorbia peplus]|nr:U2 small nuclear ribonucleoprotein A [Euphorbia peplus]
MVRLTAELIWKSPHFFNAIKERELDLRGNKIPVIENIGATEDQFDTIDFSDNEIVKLENMPYLNRLGTLLINNNRITRINPNIGDFLPKLHSLVLTNNRLVNLVEIDPLASLSKLHFLCLLDNNITKKPNYRLYVIYKLKSLRVLDFKKVKIKERVEAERLFASREVEEEVVRESIKTVTANEVVNAKEVIEEKENPKMVAPTPEQIIAIKAAIINSQTLEEVARLEKALSSGLIPADLKILETNLGSNIVMEKDDKMNSEKPDEMEAELGNLGDQMGTEPMEQVPSCLCYTFGLYFPDCFALLVIVNRGPWLYASSTYDSELAFCESLNLGKKSSTSCMMTTVV